MATIGVTRGLGDHDLKVYNSNIYIKPFLSCVPEVSVRSREQLWLSSLLFAPQLLGPGLHFSFFFVGGCETFFASLKAVSPNLHLCRLTCGAKKQIKSLQQ